MAFTAWSEDALNLVFMGNLRRIIGETLINPALFPPAPSIIFTARLLRSEDALNLFFMGNSRRIMGETLANRSSSRSHAVFTLAVSSEREEEEEELNGGNPGGGDDVRGETRTIVGRAELTLVDLAGYERMYKNDPCG